MSSRKRSLYSEDRGDRKRYKESKHDGEKLKKQVTKLNQEVKVNHTCFCYFLAHSPTKGKEVNMMQCWRCKRYGHRTGDRECPFFIKGNQELEQFRVAHEDPMYNMIRENKKNVKETRDGVKCDSSRQSPMNSSALDREAALAKGPTS
uniref:RP9 pre-mRNA splicing factor n=1 Tax=Hucho hucho TaxID=62062 RepID=A0A4W5N109_9TELE